MEKLKKYPIIEQLKKDLEGKGNIIDRILQTIKQLPTKLKLKKEFYSEQDDHYNMLNSEYNEYKLLSTIPAPFQSKDGDMCHITYYLLVNKFGVKSWSSVPQASEHPYVMLHDIYRYIIIPWTQYNTELEYCWKTYDKVLTAKKNWHIPTTDDKCSDK